MRLKLAGYLVLSSLVCAAPLVAQEAYKAKLVTESLLLDIDIANDHLLVVGERGHVLRSSDGENWQQDDVPSLATLTAISIFEDKGWAVGHDATILYKADKDADWLVQMYQPELERPLLDVLFIDGDQGIAIGAYGTFFRTLDGGETWISEMHPEFLTVEDQEYLEEIKLEDEAFYLEELASILPHLNRLSRSGERLYLAGESGLLAYSDDFGMNWQRMEIDYEGSFFDIIETPSGRLLAAGLRGNLFEFNKTDSVWGKIDSKSKASLNSIVLLENEQLMVVGNNGNVLCLATPGTEQNQTKENEAINNAVLFKQKIVAVTAGGIQIIQPDQELSTCKRISSHL